MKNDIKKCQIQKYARWKSWNHGNLKDLIEKDVEENEVSYDERQKVWYIGLEWDEVREFVGVEVEYGDSAVPDLKQVAVQYWNSNWPRIATDRSPGARKGWDAVEDKYRGGFISACSVKEVTDKIHKFTFLPLDSGEINSCSDGGPLEWSNDYRVTFRKAMKLRVIFEGKDKPEIKSLKVFSKGLLEKRSMYIYMGNEKTWNGNVSVINGEILSVSKVKTDGEGCSVKVEAQCVKAKVCAADNTMITVSNGDTLFTYKPVDLDLGLINIEDYKVVISTKKVEKDDINKVVGSGSFYEQIFDLPEQTEAQAFDEIIEPNVAKQDHRGRYVILGWEGIRQEYALRYNGEIFNMKRLAKMSPLELTKIRWAGNAIYYRLASGDPPEFNDEPKNTTQWMPDVEVPVYCTRWVDREIEYTQTTFGALFETGQIGPDSIKGDEEIIAFNRVAIRNTTGGTKKAKLWLNIIPGEELQIEDGKVFSLGRTVPGPSVKFSWVTEDYDEKVLRCVVKHDEGTIRALPLYDGVIVEDCMKRREEFNYRMDGQHDEAKASSSIPNSILYEVVLKEGETKHIDFTIPFSSFTKKEDLVRTEEMVFEDKKQEITDYWKKFAGMSSEVKLPSEILSNFIKVVPWHIMMTAAKDKDSKNYVLPASAIGYGSCGNEWVMHVRFLDMVGYHKHAEAYLKTLVDNQGTKFLAGDYKGKEGAFCSVEYSDGRTSSGSFGYNLDQGFILSSLADHYFLTGDKDWLIKVATSMVDGCDFITRERESTKQLDNNGEKEFFYGLLPVGKLEDNNEWEYWFAVNGQACGGMLRTVKALKEINHPQVERLIKDTKAYKDDVLNAVDRSIAMNPVIMARDGKYMPKVPTRTGSRTRDWGWFREACYGALHLVDGLVLDANDDRVKWILKDLEDNLFPSKDYGRPVDLEKLWFSQSGVTIQANLLNNGPAYLMRDQIKHAVRAFYNNVGQQLFKDLLLFTEHPVIELGHGIGPFFKTGDESQALIWLRNYMIFESNDDLWICKGAPSEWFKDGETISLNDMPTFYGKLSYKIESKISQGVISANYKLEKREDVKTIYFRVRHPEEKAVTKVMLNGAEYSRYNAKTGTIEIDGSVLKADIEIIF